MITTVQAIPVAFLLAAGTTEPAPAPEAAPAPAAGEPAPAAEPAPSTDQTIEDNGWGPSEPAPAAAPAAAAAAPTPAVDPAEEERQWQLRQHNRFKGMMISGFTVLGAVYGGSVLIGALAIDLAEGDDAERRRKYGRRMMIPIGGPFAAAPVSRSATLGVLTVAAGLGQVLGLSMGIAGALKLKQYPNPNKKQFAFGVAPTWGGAQVGVMGRF